MPNEPRILVVDDEQENLRALERTLRGRFGVVCCERPEVALQEVQAGQYAVVISDQRMPGMLGTDFLAKVATLSPMTTRVILTAFTETKEILDAINRAEIYRYITKPWDNNELLTVVQHAAERFQLLTEKQALISHLEQKEKELTSLNQNLEKIVSQRTAELKLANERLNELAMTDPLTKVWNRRAFFQRFNEEIERSRRYKHQIVIAMTDVDHFKQFNDMEGHVYGDEALRKIAQTLLSKLRKTDVLCRYGGEEFVIMMPETTIEHGLEICERLRSGVEDTTFQGQKAAAYLTISIGLAGYPRQGQSPEDLVKAADQALYRAKQDGRNRVAHKAENESFFVR